MSSYNSTACRTSKVYTTQCPEDLTLSIDMMPSLSFLPLLYIHHNLTL